MTVCLTYLCDCVCALWKLKLIKNNNNLVKIALTFLLLIN